jgi:ATP-dependent Clp protease ATP-binding subunit ClpA
MLQIMDEGILCDSRGRKISFKNTVIIMTSNIASLGKGSSSNPLGFVANSFDDNTYVTGKLREVFSSEFLSRPDEIIVFKSLSRATILKISENMLKKLEKRIFLNENIAVRFDDSVAQHIADCAKCENGARDVRRAIMTEVESPLSLLLLEKRVSPSELLLVSFKNGNILFERQEKIAKWQ